MDWLGSLVLGRQLRQTRELLLERASNGSSGGPVYEPFVKHRSLRLGNGAGVDYTRVCELFVSDQEDSEPVQRVVIIAESLADVICCRIAMVPRDFLQYGRKCHCFFPRAPDDGKCKTGAKEQLKNNFG